MRVQIAEVKTADAQASDLPTNVLIIPPKEPLKGINPPAPITTTRTDEQADYLATHVLDWTTNSLDRSDLEGFRACIRALEEINRTKTNKVMLWSAARSERR